MHSAAGESITSQSDLRDGGVEAGDLQVGIRGWRSVSLHGDQPRRRNFVRVLRRHSTSEVTHRLSSSPALSQNKKEMLCVKQSWMKHSRVLWASRERLAAHRTDRLASSPSAASRTLYPDTQPPDESYIRSTTCHHNGLKHQVTSAPHNTGPRVS